jgi:hypothetical protein
MKYTQVHDGEWFEPKPQRGHKTRCCDCGLIHRMDFRVRDGKVQIRAVRDKRATKAFRQRRPAVMVIDVRKSPFKPPF